jgi:hypothetical protein
LSELGLDALRITTTKEIMTSPKMILRDENIEPEDTQKREHRGRKN